MKKIVIINSTPRKGGNSEILAEQFAKGATESGNLVTVINLRDIGLKFCTGCLYCLKSGKCAQTDGVNQLLPVISQADVLVFATPVYYYSVCGQLKTFLDRLNPLYGKSNAFKEIYLLATSADGDRSAMDGCIKTLQGWADCFEGVKLAKTVYGTGAEERGAVCGTPAFAEAYSAGKSV